MLDRALEDRDPCNGYGQIVNGNILSEPDIDPAIRLMILHQKEAGVRAAVHMQELTHRRSPEPQIVTVSAA